MKKQIALIIQGSFVAYTSILPSADPPFQFVPSKATVPDNAFNIGASQLQAEPPLSTAWAPAAYGSRSIDIPFTLLNFGSLKLFPRGQNNLPQGPAATDTYVPGVDDFANQSACGIPDNAYWPSRVAIHPYWLKYAPAGLGLSRYCMQDVCISIWNETGYVNDDVMLKVTDICSTNPADPSYCATPADIKIDRIKAELLFAATPKSAQEKQALDGGTEDPRPVWWFFAKCWDDGLTQPAYNHPGNWFANPPLPNNLAWSETAMTQQYLNNAKSYPAAGLPNYKDGALKTGLERQQAVFDYMADWSPDQPDPKWCPVAGGKGFGNPTGACT